MRTRIFGGAVLALALLGSCRAQGKYTSAARDSARSSIDSIHAGTEFDEATRRFRSGDFDGALDAIGESLRLARGVPKSHLLRTRIYIEMGQLGQAYDATDEGLLAIDEIEAEVEEEPGTRDAERAEFHYQRGIIGEQQGMFERALASYSRSLELAPDDVAARHALAEVLVQQGNLEAAKALLTSSSGWSDGESGFRQSLGHIALLEGDADGARRLFEEAAILSPRDPSILEDLFRSRVEAKQFNEALATVGLLEKQLYYERRPDLQRLHALCHIQVRQPVEARAILKKLTEGEAGARDFDSWRLMADVALLLEDDRLLRATADRMVIAAPLRSEGFLVQSLSRRREGDIQGALASARLAVERAEEDDPTPAHLEALLVEEAAEAERAPTAGAGSERR